MRQLEPRAGESVGEIIFFGSMLSVIVVNKLYGPVIENFFKGFFLRGLIRQTLGSLLRGGRGAVEGIREPQQGGESLDHAAVAPPQSQEQIWLSRLPML